VQALAQLAPILAHRPPSKLTRETIRDLLEAVRGRPEAPAVNMVLLRSLAQASYDSSDIGHFALASREYCHFTSPIRRYPDLTIHRLLDVLLAQQRGARRRGGRAQAKANDASASLVLSDVELAQLGRHTSATERRAQQAEREARTALLLLLMQKKLGERLDGIITGLLPLGVFVQVQPYMAEGLIGVADFGTDEWRFDRESSTFIGLRSNRLIHLGQPVRVQVAAVDLIRQELTLVPVGGIGRAGVRRGRGQNQHAERPGRRGRRRSGE
jgi:ribonuclease R